MGDRSQLFDRWRELDWEARGVEQDVLRASLAALDGNGAPPTIEARERARKLRVAADALLNTVLASLRKADQRSDASDRQGPESRPWP